MEPRFTLDSTSWRRARDLLVDALERPAGERAAFLDAACAGEEALRAEVESLLAAHLQAATFLENLDTTAATALVDYIDGLPSPSVGEGATIVIANVVGDVTGDCTVNVDDLLAVVTSWGPCPAPPTACPADIAPVGAPNGVVNVDDLLTVIMNWG